jgi:hypothetical protein
VSYLEGMSTEDAFSDFRRILPRSLEYIDERVSVGTVQAKGRLLARHRHLFDVLRQFNLRLAIDLDQLVDAPESGLALTGD